MTIWRLVGYNEQGEEVGDLPLSADMLSEGGIVVVCPLEQPMAHDQAARLQARLDAAGVKAIVCSVPIQVWKVEPPAEPVTTVAARRVN